MHNNLIFNFVRESSDHGNENSWDRVPFLTLNAFKNGTASLQPAWTSNHHNFWLLPNFGSNIDVSYSAMIESRLFALLLAHPYMHRPSAAARRRLFVLRRQLQFLGRGWRLDKALRTDAESGGKSAAADGP